MFEKRRCEKKVMELEARLEDMQQRLEAYELAEIEIVSVCVRECAEAVLTCDMARVALESVCTGESDTSTAALHVHNGIAAAGLKRLSEEILEVFDSMHCCEDAI